MSSLINNGFHAWNSIYLYPIVPILASFLAVLFHELVFKKTQAFLAHEEEGSDNSLVEDGEHE
jgi:hypothetical protein